MGVLTPEDIYRQNEKDIEMGARFKTDLQDCAEERDILAAKKTDAEINMLMIGVAAGFAGAFLMVNLHK